MTLLAVYLSTLLSVFYLLQIEVAGYGITTFNNATLPAVDVEQALIDKLFKNYNKKLRPAGTVEVKFSLNLNQIINLIEKDQIIVLNVYIDHEWIDNRLKWNPAEYGNISVLRISSDQIWTPDTFVYTTADQTGFLLSQTGAYFVVQHQGIIFWPNPLTQMKVRCRMGIVWFPYDEQLCVIVFGSWSHTYHYLNYTLMNENPSLQNYTENNEWTLVKYKPFRSEIKYDNWVENDLFSEIRYKILIRRKPLFVLQNFVAPALMLCILTLVSFFIPFAQEMQIGISILLSFSVFKLRLSDDVPVQSDSIPLINIYFTLCMSFSLSAMIWFSIVNLLKDKKPLSYCIRCLILKYICNIMFIKQSSLIPKSSDNDPKIVISQPESRSSKEKAYSSKKIDVETEFSELIMKRAKKKSVDSVWVLKSSNNDLTNGSEYTNQRIAERNKALPESASISSSIEMRSSTYPANKSFEVTTATPRPSLNKRSFQALDTKTKSPEDSIPDLVLINILNKFVFSLFLLFIIFLNLFSLILFPYAIQSPLSIDD